MQTIPEKQPGQAGVWQMLKTVVVVLALLAGCESEAAPPSAGRAP